MDSASRREAAPTRASELLLLTLVPMIAGRSYFD